MIKVKKLDEIYQEFLSDVDKVKDMKGDITNLRTKLNEKQKELMKENEENDEKSSRRANTQAIACKSVNEAL